MRTMHQLPKHKNRIGYKLIAPLLCFDCHLPRNRMGEPVVDTEGCTIGHRCVKCSQKKIVVNRPKGSGWRQAFYHMIKSLRKKNAPPVK